MVDIRRSTIVDAPVEDVWNLLRDFNGHERWHPAVSRSGIEDGHPPDMVGAVRDFRLADGSRIREQLLSLSDRDRSFEYCILEAPLPLINYVARVRLKPVTDGNRTFWEWRSQFDPPAHERDRLARLVAEDIYEAGFRAIKQALSPRRQALPVPPRRSVVTMPEPTGAQAMAQAVVMMAHGGPEVLDYRSITCGAPRGDEVRIRQTAIGVNFIDVYCRTGYFDLVRPPGILGMEAAGVIESVGPGVSGFRIGERVGYAGPPPGAYANMRVMNTSLLVRLPDFLPDELAAASLLKGITASFLLHDVYRLKAGDAIVVHAAAGGVGQLLCQWAAALGATVIGTVSSDAKAQAARAAGAAHVAIHGRDDFVSMARATTEGRGADAVFDAIGRSTFEQSLTALAERGHLVSFGQASGDIGPYEIGRLAQKSITLSRPNYGHYCDTPEKLRVQIDRLFAAIQSGMIKLSPPRRYRLADAQKAHADLEDRRTTGSLILVP